MGLSAIGRVLVLAVVANAPFCQSGSSGGSNASDAGVPDAAAADASPEDSRGGGGRADTEVDGAHASAKGPVQDATVMTTTTTDAGNAAVLNANGDDAGDDGPTVGTIVEPSDNPACGQLVNDARLQYDQVIKGQDGFLVGSPNPVELNCVRADGVLATSTGWGTSGGAIYSVYIGDGGGPELITGLGNPCAALAVTVTSSGHVLTVFSNSGSTNSCANSTAAFQWRDGASAVLQSTTMPMPNVFVQAAAPTSNDQAAVAFNPVANSVASATVLLLDAALAIKARWSPPPGVTLSALAPLKNGTIMVVGTTGSSAPQVWLDAIDESTLSSVWSSPVMGGPGTAQDADVTASGNVVVDGYNPKASTGFGRATFFLQEFDPSGTPLWSPRPEASTDTSGTLVAVQSDGAIFGSGGWIYKPCP